MSQRFVRSLQIDGRQLRPPWLGMKTVLQEAASVDVILSLEGAAVSLLQNFDLRAMWQYMIISNSRDQKGVISKFNPDCSRMFLAVQSICVTEESVGGACGRVQLRPAHET
jgi:hypothetical protein